MIEAYIYDAVRTPRGKGKKDGSLHEVKPVNLLAGVLTELQRRNDFDTAQVDDIKSISGKDLEVTKEGDKVVVSFSYQREIHLVGPGWLTLKYAGRSK